MADFVKSVVDALEAGGAVTLVTLVGPRSLPGSWLGRRIVLGPAGRIEGTLGSAELDERVIRRCSGETAGTAAPRRISLALGEEESELLGLAPGAELQLFLDVMTPDPTLLIVGAGHIAQPLAAIAGIVGFRVVVLDDRASFANRERFPGADQILVGYFTQELARFPINRSTYVVIVTRGHAHDEASLRAVIDSDAAYIGMIGSRRKVRTILDNLAGSGIPREQLGRVYSPIGVDIGAESPAEIALSIMAEVVNVRRRGAPHCSSMSRAMSHGG